MVKEPVADDPVETVGRKREIEDIATAQICLRTCRFVHRQHGLGTVERHHFREPSGQGGVNAPAPARGVQNTAALHLPQGANQRRRLQSVAQVSEGATTAYAPRIALGSPELLITGGPSSPFRGDCLVGILGVGGFQGISRELTRPPGRLLDQRKPASLP